MKKNAKKNDQRVWNENEDLTISREILTDKEAASFLRVSQITLWRLRKLKKITFRRVSSKIVYLKKDLEDYLNQNKRAANN